MEELGIKSFIIKNDMQGLGSTNVDPNHTQMWIIMKSIQMYIYDVYISMFN